MEIFTLINYIYRIFFFKIVRKYNSKNLYEIFHINLQGKIRQKYVIY